jgi:hypothetical protein
MSSAFWVTNHVSHKNTHLEELTIIWVNVCEHFRPQVQRFYLAADRAGFIRWDNLPEGTTREYWEEKGFVFYGRWGSEFDEHATLDAPRKEKESALSLFANKIGITEHPKFKHMLKWISWLDQNEGRSQFLLPSIVKIMNDFGWDPDVVMKWTFIALEAIYAASPECFGPPSLESGRYWGKLVADWMITQFGKKTSLNDLFRHGIRDVRDPMTMAAFLKVENTPAMKRLLEFTQQRWTAPGGNVFQPHVIVEAIRQLFGEELAAAWAFKLLTAIHRQALDFIKVEEDYRKASKYPVKIGNRAVTIVVGTSDSLQFSRRARSGPPKGCRAAVVVSRNSKGNAVITTNTQLRLDLSKVAMLLRTEELKRKGLPVPNDPALLTGENELPNGDVWYFFKEGRMMLNGSATRSLPPTVLDLKTIAGIVFAGLGVEGFGRTASTTAVTQQSKPALVSV